MKPDDKDLHIVTITVADKSDNSPVEMVSAKWLKHQRKRDAAARAVVKRWRALAAAQQRLFEVMRSEGDDSIQP
jgi:hypothetical protein